jgi:hypothetical protein
VLKRSRYRRLVLAITLSLTAAACGFLPGTGSGQTHVAGTEEQPRPRRTRGIALDHDAARAGRGEVAGHENGQGRTCAA